VRGSGKVDPRPVELDGGVTVRPWFTPGHGEALSHRVAKHVGRATEDAPRVADDPEKEKVPESESITGLPVELVKKLRELVRNTENVGRRFPEEARKIHYEEVPPRPIRGQASKDDADALREEGIDFAPLPPFLTRDQH